MEQALPFESVAFDPTVEETGDVSNMTAEEYLSWVRHQATSLPDVSRAEIDMTAYDGCQTTYMPAVGSIPCCPDKFLPNAEWEADALSDFSQLREKIASLSDLDNKKDRLINVPALRDVAGWHLFCFDREFEICQGHATRQSAMEIDAPPSSNDVDIDMKKSVALAELDGHLETVPSGDELDETNSQTVSFSWSGAVNVQPTTRLILQFDQVLTQRLLGYHVSWLDSREVTNARGQWLYSLLVRLEKPVHQDMAAVLRQLYRRCAQLRSELCDEAQGFRESLATLNILIAITGSYFGQGEEYTSDRRSSSHRSPDMQVMGDLDAALLRGDQVPLQALLGDDADDDFNDDYDLDDDDVEADGIQGGGEVNCFKDEENEYEYRSVVSESESGPNFTSDSVSASGMDQQIILATALRTLRCEQALEDGEEEEELDRPGAVEASTLSAEEDVI